MEISAIKLACCIARVHGMQCGTVLDQNVTIWKRYQVLFVCCNLHVYFGAFLVASTFGRSMLGIGGLPLLNRFRFDIIGLAHNLLSLFDVDSILSTNLYSLSFISLAHVHECV